MYGPGPTKRPFVLEDFLAHAAVALVLVGIGYWVGRRSFGASPLREPLAATTAPMMSLFSAAYPAAATSQAPSLMGDWAFPKVQITAIVSTRAVKILDGSRQGPRMVTITTDYDIRVLDGAQVSTTRGMLVSGGRPFTWPLPIGPEVQLWAVRAGASDAQVSVSSQAVRA